jgi:hypothetical protein
MKKKKFTPVAIPRCPWHNSPVTSYLQFFEDAARRNKNGERQRQCSVCSYWFWPEHFGIAPVAQLVESQSRNMP